MSSAPSTPYERLVAAAARLKVPDAVRAAAAAAPADPRPGQVWRARWGDTVELVVLARVDADTVEAAPLSMERFCDEQTLLLPGEATTLEQPVAVWCGLAATLPWCVLDRHIADLTVSPAVVRARPGSTDIPDRAWWGRPIPSPAAQDAQFRAVMEDSARILKTARWAPEGTGRITELFGQHNVRPQQLAELWKLTPAQALAAWRGQAPVTLPQAQALSVAVGLPEDEILAANPAPPPGVVHELSRPLRRWQVRKLAVQQAGTEEDTRTRAAYDLLGQAARQTGGTEIDWATRADRYFQTRLEGGDQ